MKILHICVNYGTPLFSFLFKGIGSYVEFQTVFYPRRKGHKIVKDNVEDIKLISPRILNFSTKAIYFLKIFKCKREVIKNIQIRNFDIFHAHTLFSDGGVAYKLHKLYKKPYLVTVRQSDFYFIKIKPWLEPFGKKILCNAEKIVCISHVLKRDLIQKFHLDSDFNFSKIVVIPNGIQSSFIQNTSIVVRNNLRKNARIKLLFVGSFYKLKNLHKLIYFVNQNKNKYSLTIVGSGGDYKNRILRLIGKFPYSIKYLGRVNNVEKLKSIYQQHDIFFMPSSPETFGLVYIEAMSQGTPIIYSKNAGIDLFFNEGEVGYSVWHNDTSEWTDTILKISENYSNISKNCYEISKKFTWEKAISKFIKIYTEIDNN